MRPLDLLPLALVAALAGCPPVPPDHCVPSPEECNGLDDDCDGRVDEADSGGPLRRDCSNACGSGEEECQGGAWVYCSAPQPMEEQCNGFDDDCDGRVDEDCECSHGQSRPCGTDVGECELGVERCQHGVWGECQSAYDPADHPEVCDGLDNDCDGVVDEGCSCDPGMTQPCGTDRGECSAGTMTCGPGGVWQPTCEGEVGPEPDLCDGLDNDCDGEVDYIVSIGFGWEGDDHESNDDCGDASPLFNSSGVLQLAEGGEWVSPSVADPTNLMDYPSLYPMRDEDWYATRAVEGSHTCVPWTSQCSFVVSAYLELLDRRFVEGAHQDPSDWRMCVYVGDCSAVTTPSSRFCTQGTNWDERASSYSLAVVWRGSCGADDSRDLRVQVFSPTGGACGHYQLSLRFDLDTTVPCP